MGAYVSRRTRTLAEIREACRRAATMACSECGWWPDDRGPQHNRDCARAGARCSGCDGIPGDFGRPCVCPPVAIVACEAQPVAPLPRVEHLARALFENDDRVIAFVDKVSDWSAPGTRRMAMRCADDERYAAAMQRAWDRNEHGWKSEMILRADGVIETLRRLA